jgi:hypothetical protein
MWADCLRYAVARNEAKWSLKCSIESSRGATGSVASEKASGLPHIAPQNDPSKTTTTRFLYDPTTAESQESKTAGK